MGIVLAATVVVVIGIALAQLLARSLSGRDSSALFVYLFVALPLSAVANLFFKGPLLRVSQRVFHIPSESSHWPWWFTVLALVVVVGAVEEITKCSVLLLPNARAIVLDPIGAGQMAILVGFGFGVGEACFIGWRFWTHLHPGAGSPHVWELTGFISERFLAMFLHSAFLLVAFSQLRHGLRRFSFGFTIATLLHALADSPISLFQAKIIGPAVITCLLTAEGVLSIWMICKYFEWTRGRRPLAEQSGAEVLFARSR